ncbi:ESX secretion-associated protein EspG [Saccharomonospora sp. NPDC006951]
MVRSFSLSLVAIDMLLEQLRLGRAPCPFEVPHIGTTRTQRAQVREAVFRDLEGRGMMRGGTLDDAAALALRTFVSAPVSVAAAAKFKGGDKLFARAASDGRLGVVAKQDGNMIVFTEVRPTAVISAAVDLLPAVPAAPGQSLTIPKPADRAPRHAVGVTPPRSNSVLQERAIARLFEKPKIRIGQFTAFAQGKEGKREKIGPLAWFDTEDGRFFCTQRAAEDGRQWITYAPADNGRIAQHLHGRLEDYL